MIISPALKEIMALGSNCPWMLELLGERLMGNSLMDEG